jgi:hypothetical protein
LASQAALNLGYQVFREAQVLQSLRQDRGGVLRLAAIPCEALPGLQAAPVSGFGRFFGTLFG